MEFLFVAKVYAKWKEQNWKLNWNFYSALFSADEVWLAQKWSNNSTILINNADFSKNIQKYVSKQSWEEKKES